MNRVDGAVPYCRVQPFESGPAAPQKAEGTGPEKTETRAVAEKFENLFVSMLLREMKKSLPGGSMLPGASGAFSAFETLFDQHLSDALTERGTGMSEAFTRLIDPESVRSGSVSG